MNHHPVGHLHHLIVTQVLLLLQALLPERDEALDQLAKCEVLDDAGLLHWPKGKIGRPRSKKYLSAMPGVVAGDLVLDTPPLKSGFNESIGYPTQKPRCSP